MPHKDPEVRRAYMKEWARKNRLTPEGKLRQKVNSKRSRLNNPEAVKIRKKRNYIKYEGRYKEYYRNWTRQRRLEMIDHYSDGSMSCICCGETEYEFLTLDHINGGGSKHRKELGAANIYNALRKAGYPPGYQILCFNCNCGRQRNKGICPHKRTIIVC